MKVNKKIRLRRKQSIWKSLGPGFITGASDDDPSGIATYSQAGAGFGFGMLWTAFFTFPLMASIQEMCARIGIVTSSGLTRTLKKHYPKAVLYAMILFSFPAIVLNIGADIAGMGAVSKLLYPAIPVNAYSLAFVAILIVCLIYFPYRRIANVMKWLCLILLVYTVVPFLIRQDGWLIFKATFIPQLKWNSQYLSILVAILGTTISPYLFFWQASMEGEERAKKPQLIIDKAHINEMRLDVNIGMFFSNVVMYFIILTTGSVLFRNGITKIYTVQEAADALKPLAGELAYVLFALGIIGTGFLAIPVLAGSLSYMLAETFNWEEGLDKKWHEAKGFYVVIALSIVTGFVINIAGIDPIKALVLSGIAYGVTAPVMILIILHICNNKKIMGNFTNGRRSNILGGLTLLIMTMAAAAMFVL